MDNVTDLRKKGLILLTCALILTCVIVGLNQLPVVVTPPVANSITYRIKGIRIVGTRNFVARVKIALDLLAAKDPRAFDTVRTYVQIIQESDFSQMAANANSPTFMLSNKSASFSRTWCASVIAHDSYHSKLYKDYQTSKSRIVPRWVWVGPVAERKCNDYALSVMRKIGSPESEIEHIRNINCDYCFFEHQ